ncbi:AlpA family phage regulatory protein [Sinorhizobium meliloti]|uniref:helix-turn-helix transcriptional regulator n=1 Tax=Rhizobium meliloti TaxID=382 RepID=UPI0002A5A07B|nr:AlpA family phage regulatory protein [Sinorhizobium meliloti]AGA07331.1 putative transcriptional regulator [Sinorhizobium meliloti GR4]RVK98884.1 AlpA family phage regulatory protein [Sinorhizobium meliloti]RVM87086.1 AlpA family phage regulatory protein [Sinorhizobium meliloti]RVN04329.1 AlpA family phage regulatory protein [Sinorhizobium meliloti]
MSRFYKRSQVCKITTLSESTIKRREKDDPDFFKRHQISLGRVVYDADEVDDWMGRKLQSC